MRTPKVERAPEKERAPNTGQAPSDERSSGPEQETRALRGSGNQTSNRSWFETATSDEADGDSATAGSSATAPASEAPAGKATGESPEKPAAASESDKPASNTSESNPPDGPPTQPTLILTAIDAPATLAAKAPPAGKAPAESPAKAAELAASKPAKPEGGLAADEPATEIPGETPESDPPEGPPTQPTLILTAFNAPPVLPASKAPAESPAKPGQAPLPQSANATAAALPTADPAAPDPAKKKARSSRFGSAPAVRPDVLTDAETVVLPQVESSRTKTPNQPGAKSAATNVVFRPAGNSGTVDRQQSGEAAAFQSRVMAPDEDTQILSAVAAPPAVRERPAERYKASRRTSMISRAVLLGILCLQAIMSLRLRNTAFQDEALYLYSGRMELEHMLHGASLYGNFASYFPGAPVLYPVAAAALDQVGGLALARALSLVEMLAVTSICYSIARYLFNERVGLCAAAIFSVAESTLFLCNFATMDATSLFLLAAAAWIMVFTARSRWPVFLLAAPVAALAVAVKYGGVLWIPTIAVLPILTTWPDRLKRVWFYPVCFLAVVGELLFVGLQLGGHVYATAVKNTADPAHGTTSVATVLADSLKWGGVLFALAVFGSIAYVWRVHTESGEQIAPAGGRWRRAALGLILTATALLAPAYQAYLHSDASLGTYIGFGLFFAAPMAGFGLVRIMGDYFRWPQIGIAIFSVALVLGLLQSNDLYHGWPQSTAFVNALSGYLKPNANYLVEVPDVPIYYLQGRSDAQPKQFTSTFSVAPLNTAAKFAAAVKDGEFQVIAYNDDLTPATDAALAKALKASSSYTLAKKVYIGFAYGSSPYYYIWVKHTPAKAKAKAKA
jgi:hypothetical protein